MKNQNSSDNGISGNDDSNGSTVEDSFINRWQSFRRDLFQTYEIIRNIFYSGLLGAFLALLPITVLDPKARDIMILMYWFIFAVFGSVIGLIGMIVAILLYKKLSFKWSYVPWVGYLLSAITSFATMLIFYFA